MNYAQKVALGASMTFAALPLIGCPGPDKTPSKTAAMVARPAGSRPWVSYVRKAEDGDSITVDVSVSEGAIVVDPAKPPAARTKIATFVNRGGKKEKLYKFKPSSEATYELYAENRLDASTNTTAYTFVETAIDGTTSTLQSGGFFNCADGHANTVAAAGFKRCGRPRAAPASAVINRSSLASFSMYRRLFKLLGFQPTMDSTGGGPGDPAWVACSDGCCTTGREEQ